jgi:hypothetical protein
MDVLEWRTTPGYAVCPAGTAGWFWVAWDTVSPDEATDAAPPPRLAGYALTEDAAHAQARTAVEPIRVRPRSKHSDPAWRAYTLMLKSETHTEVAIILKRLDNGQDLSDLAQELFE